MENTALDLMDKIKRSKKEDKTLLIAIDGFGGSGKSTLANQIKAALVNVTIVHLDDFYAPELKRADRARVVEQVIGPLAKNAKANYQRYDWPTGKLAEWHEIPPGGIVVLEGVTALHPDFGENYALKIWLDLSQAKAAKRGIARDLNEYQVDTRENWEKEWMPREREYFDSIRPDKRADMIIRIKD
jgi:uridine kinase